MKLIPVYKVDGEYGKKLDMGEVKEYDSPEDAQKAHGSDKGRSETVVWLEVPEGLDAREVIAVEDTPGVFELQSDPTKLAATVVEDKTAAITIKYDEMNTDVLAEMFTLFGTTKPESANAYYETWKRMSAAEAMFSSEGLTSDRQLIASDEETILFEVDDALDTDAKILSYSNRLLEMADAYSVSRMKRIKQFRDEKKVIEDS